jgi:hypothetical protein
MTRSKAFLCSFGNTYHSQKGVHKAKIGAEPAVLFSNFQEKNQLFTMPKRQADEDSRVQHSVWTIDYNPSNGFSDMHHPDGSNTVHGLPKNEYLGWDAVSDLTAALWSERPHPQSGTEAVSFLRKYLQNSENSGGVSVRDFDPSSGAGRSGQGQCLIYVDVTTGDERAKRVATGRK